MSDCTKTTLELAIGPITIVAKDGTITGSLRGPLSVRALRALPSAGRSASTHAVITGIYFADHAGAPDLDAIPSRHDAPILRRAREQLAEYAAGHRRTFDLPIAAEGTAFQRAVWSALRSIPYGERVSYAELAKRIDRPRAIRAVGAANAKNPLSILVPCHRVIGSSGALTGYAGGLAAKEWLLAHEARHPG